MVEPVSSHTRVRALFGDGDAQRMALKIEYRKLAEAVLEDLLTLARTRCEACPWLRLLQPFGPAAKLVLGLLRAPFNGLVTRFFVSRLFGSFLVQVCLYLASHITKYFRVVQLFHGMARQIKK